MRAEGGSDKKRKMFRYGKRRKKAGLLPRSLGRSPNRRRRFARIAADVKRHMRKAAFRGLGKR